MDDGVDGKLKTHMDDDNNVSSAYMAQSQSQSHSHSKLTVEKYNSSIKIIIVIMSKEHKNENPRSFFIEIPHLIHLPFVIMNAIPMVNPNNNTIRKRWQSLSLL